MKTVFAISLLFLSASAFAGSATLTCATPENDIRYAAGNASNLIQIDYSDHNTKQKGTYEVPVRALPNYDYNSAGGDTAILSIPISEKKYTSKSCKQVHVIHADGSECYGRQFWEVIYSQSFVLAGNDGRSLDRINVLHDRDVPGKISDGYIVRNFECTDEGVTTPGGCFMDPDDKLDEEVDIDCSEMGF